MAEQNDFVRPVPVRTMITVRAEGDTVGAMSELLGLALPTEPSTVGRTGDRTAIWMGPDEWLVLDETTSGVDLEAALLSVSNDGSGSAVDVSSQRVALRLRAPWARDVLSAGCAVDLHPAVFGTSSAAQTNLALAGVVILAGDESGTDYTILVRTTFATYLLDWLQDAASEHLLPA